MDEHNPHNRHFLDRDDSDSGDGKMEVVAVVEVNFHV